MNKEEKIKKRAIIKVYGKVQGVFFRHSTKLMAQEFGLKGFVRNEIDGSVLIVAEGEAERLNELIKWARIGPPSAEVKNIEIKWEDYQGEFNEFFIA